MLRLVGGIIGLAVLGAFIYLAATVELGPRTFFGHVRAIAQSRESRELYQGVVAKAGEIFYGARKKNNNGSPPAEKNTDQLSPQEQEALRRLIRERMKPSSPTKPTPAQPTPKPKPAHLPAR